MTNEERWPLVTDFPCAWLMLDHAQVARIGLLKSLGGRFDLEGPPDPLYLARPTGRALRAVHQRAELA